MRSLIWRALAIIGLLTGLPLAGPVIGDEDAAMPVDLAGYRFINALVINNPDDPLFGFHHFYVNEQGLESLRDGGPYPVGAMFIGLVYNVLEDGKTLNEGDAVAIAIMEKVAGAEETGGWRFALHDPSGETKAIDPVADCFQCHTRVRDRDYVFSQPLEVGDRLNIDLGADSES